MPYIYSFAWKVTNEGYTPMRALVMDFRTDVRAQNIGDQFMFGPGDARQSGDRTGRDIAPRFICRRRSGTTFGQGRDRWRVRYEAAAPARRIPLYVRAGSIMPMGPDME